MEDQGKGNLWVAVSVILAGVIIAGAVIFTNGGESVTGPTTDPSNGAVQADPSSIEPVTEDDHIRGDINAPVKIVEYSDTECPFCKRLHETLKQVVSEYEGQVAWVYRHMPLARSHPKAPIEAAATECVAELGGEEKFWEYLDRIYDETPGNNRLDLDLLPQFAEDLGIDRGEFESCLDSGRHDEKIAASVQDGFEAGSEGTPYSVVITPDGQYVPVGGAQPIEVWRQLIESLVGEGAAGIEE